MLADRIEGKWIDAFCEHIARVGAKRRPGSDLAASPGSSSRATALPEEH